MILFGHFKAYWSHSQSKIVFIFSFSCILALVFPIVIKYFPKCEGKGSFLKTQIKSLRSLIFRGLATDFGLGGAKEIGVSTDVLSEIGEKLNVTF